MAELPDDVRLMARAIELARRGEGRVEPNPMVGSVVVLNGRIVGEGWHQEFGGPHAEVNALADAAALARGATLYVTLEPCCHTGKTPPCTEAILRAGVSRVVAAIADPFPKVAGGGVAALRAAGVECEVGVGEAQAREVLAPYLKLVVAGRPWVIAKWAMTLDGKIATHTGSSKWISSEGSRAVTHALRGRVDAIMVGGRTAAADDPLLTVRPPLGRVPTRIVLGPVRVDSRVVESTSEAPLLVVVATAEEESRLAELRAAGAEVLRIEGATRRERLTALLDQLGALRMTNILVEGGGRLLGELFDAQLIDEVHAFVAPKLIGGAGAPTPLAGNGIVDMNHAINLHTPKIERIGSDVYVSGRLMHDA